MKKITAILFLLTVVMLMSVCVSDADNTPVPASTENGQHADADNTSVPANTENGQPADAQDGGDIFALYGTEEMRDFYNGFQENTPVSVEIRISGEASGEPVVYRDKDTIVKLFQALADITVVKKTNEHVTDRYLSVTFELADGNCISLGFEGGWLNIGEQNYVIENASAFWDICDELTEE